MRSLRTLVPRQLSATALIMLLASAVLAVLALQQLTTTSTRIAGTSGTAPRTFVAEIPVGGGLLCQPGSRLPEAAGQVQLLLGTYGRPGPALVLSYRNPNGRTVFAAPLKAGWAEGLVSIPLRDRPRDLDGVTACVRSSGGSRLAFGGEAVGPVAVVDGTPQPGRVSITGYASKAQSTLNLLPELGRRLGRGSASLLGSWTVLSIMALVAFGVAAGGVAVAAAIRPEPPLPEGSADDTAVHPPSGRRGLRFLRRLPPAGYAITGAALAITLGWALLTPPFQVPDETSHVAYVQYLAESGELPKEVAGTAAFSEEENQLLGALGFARVIGRTNEKVLSTATDERYLRTVENGPFNPQGNGNVANASSNPPLYYLLATPLYKAASGGGLLTQVLAMRMLSVLFTTLSVLLAFLFLRELFPASPRAWVFGGLACAFQPVLGFVGGGVTPDSLLFLCATGSLFLCARVLRRGLTVRRGVALGLIVLAGLLTKPVFLALVPAVMLAILLGWLKSPRTLWRAALAAGAVIVVPMIVYTLLASSVLDHPYFGVASDVASTSTGGGAVDSSLTRAGSFVFQLFLPRPPFLTDLIPGLPLKDIWLNGLVGVFGWVDYGFARPKVDFAMHLFEVLLLLSGVALFKVRKQFRSHLALGAVCLTALAGVLAAVGLTDYQASITNAPRFEQARYLLPLLGLYGGLFALAAKGLGTRLTRYALPALWVLVALHTVAAMVLTANRYYL